MTIQWTLSAIEDRESIFDFLEADSFQAAVTTDDRIEARIEARVEALFHTPEIGRPGRVPGTRELAIHRTPFLAVYRIEGRTISILRILHGARQWPEALEAFREP